MSKLVSFFRRPAGDDFEALVTPHIERLYRLAYRFCGAEQPAEDLVQDLLLKLYPRRHELAQIDELSPWLARSLYNHFIDTTRRDRRTPLHDALDDSVLASMPVNMPTPEEDAENRCMQQQLLHAMDGLGPMQRALVSLHDIEGYTLHELETMLETPIGTLKSRLHRSRKQLRDALQMEPFDLSQRVNRQRTGK